MAKEKNKLKAMQEMVKTKQGDLSQALEYSKINDMENRLQELKIAQVQTDKQLHMLEGLRKKQIHCIENHNKRDERDMQ